MKGIINCPNWSAIFGDSTYDIRFCTKNYDMSINPEDYTWEVISKTEPAPPIEEDFNPWTDREYAL